MIMHSSSPQEISPLVVIWENVQSLIHSLEEGADLSSLYKVIIFVSSGLANSSYEILAGTDTATVMATSGTPSILTPALPMFSAHRRLTSAQKGESYLDKSELFWFCYFI